MARKIKERKININIAMFIRRSINFKNKTLSI